MKAGQWDAEWLASAAPVERELWRGVEAQHRVATTRLVDSIADQKLLEELLEASKPPLPINARDQHWLIATPFRYTSPHPTRFRAANEPGVWYGADSTAIVAAELAPWRWRFLMDSKGLQNTDLVSEHTFFQARFSGVELDLTRAPWHALRDVWRDDTDYTACQALSQYIRQSAQPAIAAIRYESVRQEQGVCEAVLVPSALSLPAPHRQQTWVCKTTRQRVMFTHDEEAFEYLFA